MRSIAKRFGANLKAVRRASDLSQERLGLRAGVHRSEVGLLERGQRVPRIDTVAKLARALGIGPGELLIGTVAALDSRPLSASAFALDPESDQPRDTSRPHRRADASTKGSARTPKTPSRPITPK